MDKKDNSIYLDYNATTPLEVEVLEAIQSALKCAWGNPSSQYPAGLKAKKIIDAARSHIADMVAGTASDIIFTSGGTEANNMVLQTALQYFTQSYPKTEREKNGVRPHIITSNLEHDSIKLVLEHFQETKLADVTFVAASKKTGRVEVDDILSAVRPTTIMVTVMTANNETGVVQPVAQICERLRLLRRDLLCETSRILLHTDAAQACGKINVSVQDLGVDYLTIVGHKFYGPRIGAVYVKGLNTGTPLEPMFYGGGQERNFRPGTENTGMIAGLGQAAELVVKHGEIYEAHMREVRDYLESRLVKVFGDDVRFNGKFTDSERLPNTCNVSILGTGLLGDKILARVCHVQASVGAACHAGAAHRASPILLAIGVPVDIASNALRLSVGRHTTKADIDTAVNDIWDAVEKLKAEVAKELIKPS